MSAKSEICVLYFDVQPIVRFAFGSVTSKRLGKPASPRFCSLRTCGDCGRWCLERISENELPNLGEPDRSTSVNIVLDLDGVQLRYLLTRIVLNRVKV
jgi:hypothetical protein